MSIIKKGNVIGIGDVVSRENEITPERVASFRNFCIGYNEFNNVGGTITSGFELSHNGVDTINISEGTMFAYGYIGMCKAHQFVFNIPAVEQYHIIYVEINRSVIPNTCTISSKNNQGSSKILKNTFRQDELTSIKTGVFQFPLWEIHLTNEGIFDNNITDLRKVKYSIEKVESADYTHAVTGILQHGVTAVTPYESIYDENNPKLVATTKFVLDNIEQALKS